MPWSKVGNMTPPVASTVEPYVRPADWLTLPTVNAGDNKLVGLFAVWPHDSNHVALTATGAFTVDWGDGQTQNIASGVQANHTYTYASLSAATDCSRGYRQVIITVTPQAGQTLTTVDLAKKHSVGGAAVPGTGWLDICMAGQSITNFNICADRGSTAYIIAPLLEQFEFKGTSAIGNVAYQFLNLSGLQIIKGNQWSAAATSASGMFIGCEGLRIIAGLTLNVANAAAMLGTVRNLQQVSNFSLPQATDASSLFSSCAKLEEVLGLNLPKAVTVASLFYGCSSLQKVSGVVTSVCQDFSNMFSNCSALRSVGALTTDAGTNFSSMFASCSTLREVPAFNTSLGTNFASMFNTCSALQSVPLFDLSKATNCSSMFTYCYALQAAPAFNLGASTSNASMFNDCRSLSSVAITNIKASIGFSNCRLSSAALNAIYTSLLSATSQTITVTGNYGTASDTPSIATGKSWTVTGS